VLEDMHIVKVLWYAHSHSVCHSHTPSSHR